tara:strand:+ start:37396 stop:38895 length:1500 start_codon:yes stop_codon:yes gene_type:complete
MPLLTRKKVLTIDRNRITTLPTTLDGAASATNIVLEAVAKLDVERIDRQIASTSLSSSKDLAGQKAVEFTFGIEMKGTNAGTGEPAWSKILDGCGFTGEAISSMVIGTITAASTSTTFRHGETITGETSGATATVVMDTHDGQLIIYYDTSSLAVGTFNGTEVIVGLDSGATATTSTTASAAGHAWWPISSVEKKIIFVSGTGLTTALAVGDIIAGTSSGARGIVTRAASTGVSAIVYYNPIRGTFAGSETMERVNNTAVGDIGDLESSTAEQYEQFPTMGMKLFTDGKAITGNNCRGNVVFNLEVNRPVRMDFSFRGALASTADTLFLTGIDYENVDPPLWESSAIGYAQNETAAESLLSDEFEPCLKTLSIDVGNQNSDRKCAGAASGLLEVATAARDGTGSMSVDDTLESDVGWLARLQDNETARLRLTVGSVAGNKFTFSMPGVQFTDHGEGDENGIVTQDMSFRLTGGNLFDLRANNALSANGGDNELVIIYHI